MKQSHPAQGAVETGVPNVRELGKYAAAWIAERLEMEPFKGLSLLNDTWTHGAPSSTEVHHRRAGETSTSRNLQLSKVKRRAAAAEGKAITSPQRLRGKVSRDLPPGEAS